MCWNFQTETSIEQICADYRLHNIALACRYNFKSQWKEIANDFIFSLPFICSSSMKWKKKLWGSYELHFLRYLNLQSNGQAEMSEINWYLFEHIFFFQITLLVIKVLFVYFCLHSSLFAGYFLFRLQFCSRLNGWTSVRARTSTEIVPLHCLDAHKQPAKPPSFHSIHFKSVSL